MSNGSIERFKFVCNGLHTANARMESNADGNYIHYSDHERIVKELEARLVQHESDIIDRLELIPRDIAARDYWRGRSESLSDAIKEVCTWTKYKESDEFGFDHYSTTCGRDTGNSGEFAPAWTHCPYCGKALEVENG